MHARLRKNPVLCTSLVKDKQNKIVTKRWKDPTRLVRLAKEEPEWTARWLGTALGRISGAFAGALVGAMIAGVKAAVEEAKLVDVMALELDEMDRKKLVSTNESKVDVETGKIP